MYYDERQVFASTDTSKYRIPSVIATSDGSLFAFCNDRRGTLKDHAEVLSFVRKGDRAEQVRDGHCRG